ncbi:hypothetical protein [Paramagnetospirillum magneticum]|uniref:hypothetical protein n=1 Tax=Paramagnetospirillum magneticum TaxID=84159 RepID=UPI0005C1DC29|nr:hypothetical protein [Paramagnetospirillum magneticum]
MKDRLFKASGAFDRKITMMRNRNCIAADFYADATRVPKEVVAYVLLIHMADSLPVKLAGRPEVTAIRRPG